MGYRIKLGTFPKDKYDIYENKSMEEVQSYLEEQEDLDKVSYSPYYPKFHKPILELGKYVSFEKGRLPFYKQFDVYQIYGCEFDILTKLGLKYIIDSYHTTIKENFINYFDMFRVDSNEIKLKNGYEVEIYEYFSSKKREWDDSNRFYVCPYKLDEPFGGDGEIVNSWKYEYGIFNLVYIYRTFDFESNLLIYSGW